MLAAVDLARRVQRQRGADGVRAARVFAPQITGRERHALRLMQKLIIAEGIQHETGIVRGDHNRRRAAQALTEPLHQRAGKRFQPAVLRSRLFKQGAADKRGGVIVAGQPIALAALPGVIQQTRKRQVVAVRR